LQTTTTPNKETVRRISVLHKAKYCYLLVIPTDPLVYILSDIATSRLDQFARDLEEWSGMKFQVYNEKSAVDRVNNIKKNGEKILPIVL